MAKLIPFKTSDVGSTADILTAVLRDSRNSGGVDFEEMGQRIDLIKKLKANDKPDGIVVDDDEHKLITRLITVFKFGVADEGLYDIIAAVKAAKEPPAAMLQ